MIYVIDGNFVSQKASLEKIKESLIDYDVFYIDENDNFYNVMQLISESSCLDEYKLFIITGFPDIGISDKSKARTKILNEFKKIFSKIPQKNIIIFKNLNISSKPFLDEVKKCNGKIINSFKVRDKRESFKIVENYFKNKEIEINHEQINMIIESINSIKDEIDLNKLYLSCLKLCSYASNKKKITDEDIYNIFSFSKEFVVWNLFNFLDNGDLDKSLMIIAPYLEQSKYINIEIENILRLMIWRYGLMLLIRSMKTNDSNKIYDILSEIKKMKQTGISQRMKMEIKNDENDNIKEEYSKYNIINMLNSKSVFNHYSYNDLNNIYFILVNIFSKIRSGKIKNEFKFLFFMLLSFICGKLNKEEKTYFSKLLYPIKLDKEIIYGNVL